MLVSVLAYAGLRPESEALPLKWADIGERAITVRATKTNTTRHVRLLEPLADDLPPAAHQANPIVWLERPAVIGPRRRIRVTGYDARIGAPAWLREHLEASA